MQPESFYVLQELARSRSSEVVYYEFIAEVPTIEEADKLVRGGATRFPVPSWNGPLYGIYPDNVPNPHTRLVLVDDEDWLWLPEDDAGDGQWTQKGESQWGLQPTA